MACQANFVIKSGLSWDNSTVVLAARNSVTLVAFIAVAGCSIQTPQQRLDELDRHSELLELRSENIELLQRSQSSELTATQLNEILLNLPRSSDCVQVSTNQEGIVNAAAINCALCPCNI